MPAIQSSCFLQASHYGVSTTVLSSLLTLQHSHESVLYLRSNCDFHLLKLVTVKFVFLELVVGALLAVLLWLDLARSRWLEVVPLLAISDICRSSLCVTRTY